MKAVTAAVKGRLKPGDLSFSQRQTSRSSQVMDEAESSNV
jgi:hypothetical protein